MKLIRPISIAFILGSSLVPAGSNSATTGRPCGFVLSSTQADDLQQKLQKRVVEVREAGGYPGMTAAIAMPDGRVLVAAAGWADGDKKIPMKPTDRMLAGSVGKTFVAAVILEAVDEGQLDL